MSRHDWPLERVLFALAGTVSRRFGLRSAVYPSAKEHRDRTSDPKDAMVGGVAHSGRVIFAADAALVRLLPDVRLGHA